MLRLLADENFNGDIVRGLLRQRPDLDIVRVQDVGIAGCTDEDVLAWAGQQNRMVLTHDRATMPAHAFDRLDHGDFMAGVFVLNDRFPVGAAIDELLLVIDCTEQAEWVGKVVHLPLR